MLEYLDRTPVSTLSTHWKDVVHMLPPPLCDVMKPRSWKHFCDAEAISASLARVHVVGYDEKLVEHNSTRIIQGLYVDYNYNYLFFGLGCFWCYTSHGGEFWILSWIK